MNDIEAAAFARYWGKPSPHDASLRAVAEAAWMARSALAHAARGEGEERPVHRDDEWWIRRINEAHKHGGLPWLVTVAKNFPRDEGSSATPPPATGEAGRHGPEATRGILDSMPPAGCQHSWEGSPYQRCALCGAEGYDDHPKVERIPHWAMDEARCCLVPDENVPDVAQAILSAYGRGLEDAAKWHDERAETSGNERAAWWHKDCAAAIRAGGV